MRDTILKDLPGYWLFFTLLNGHNRTPRYGIHCITAARVRQGGAIANKLTRVFIVPRL